VGIKLRILIIGSKGFIGSHTIRFLSETMGHECWGCDVIVDYNNSRYFLADSTNGDFNELFTAIEFDVCVNCSGAASVPDSLQHPFRDFSLNTFNVIKILEAIRKHTPTCRFINLSSAAVYGNPLRLPISEKDECRPVSPYGLHKLSAEALCKEYYDYFKIRTCSLRIFSAYGNGLQKQIFWDIAKKAIKAHTKIKRSFVTGIIPPFHIIQTRTGKARVPFHSTPSPRALIASQQHPTYQDHAAPTLHHPLLTTTRKLIPIHPPESPSNPAPYAPILYALPQQSHQTPYVTRCPPN
jgi:hypothetical protein